MLERLHVRNYRSLRDTAIEFGQITVVTGPNGSGKSNLYRALELVAAAASGEFARALLAEGGMPSALWAGPRSKGPVRMSFSTRWSDLTHEIHAGLIQVEPGSPFVLDPEIKDEYVFLGSRRTPSSTLVERSGVHAKALSVDGERRRTLSLRPSESILSQIGEPGLYPELFELRRRISGWRFYHQFDTRADSPLRRARAGIRTDALASDGNDLGAAICTLAERGDERALDDAVDRAFPGYSVAVAGEPGTFAVSLVAPGLARPLAAREFSDGQLRFLCLAVALLSTRPPELLVLNEPETSLHPSAVVALAPLIVAASAFSQVWVTTHDHGLRDALQDHALVSSLDLGSDGTRVVADDGTPP